MDVLINDYHIRFCTLEENLVEREIRQTVDNKILREVTAMRSKHLSLIFWSSNKPDNTILFLQCRQDSEKIGYLKFGL